MEFPTSDIIRLIYELLPGFFAAWIFFGLTPHKRKSPFERTVQALIFTGIVKIVLWPMKTLFLRLGKCEDWVWGVWSQEVNFFWSVLIATLIGFLFSHAANRGWFHDAIRKLKISKKTSSPSEWFSTFYTEEFARVVLHLEDGSRIAGKPFEYSDYPDKGHIVLTDASWVEPDNTLRLLHGVSKLLIRSKDVVLIEFEKCNFPVELEEQVKQATAEAVQKDKEAKDATKGVETETSSDEETETTLIVESRKKEKKAKKKKG